MNNTGLEPSFPVAKRMKIGAYSRCGTGDFGAQGSENSTNERDRMEETHKLLPFLISSSNPSEDIEGE